MIVCKCKEHKEYTEDYHYFDLEFKKLYPSKKCICGKYTIEEVPLRGGVFEYAC